MTMDFDFYPACLGEVLHARYRVHRKLGSGAHSATWLVSDAKYEDEKATSFGSKYLAVKILTADVTRRHIIGQTREQHFLELIRGRGADAWGLPYLCDHFQVTGPNGPHLCFVMYILGNSVSDLRRPAPYKALHHFLVKSIISQLLDAVAQLHEMEIIHADIKPANILINSARSDEDVQKYLDSSPPSIAEYVQLPGETTHRALLGSQPLPFPLSWDCTPKDAELLTVTLIDFGKSQVAGQQPTLSSFAPLALRSPEEILGCYLGPKLDIWTIGCITFELLTGRWLFHPEAGDTWTVDDDHLAKMMELTGERFNDIMLRFSHERDRFFDHDGNLLRVPELFPVPLEEAIAVYNVAPKEDVPAAAAFVRACLRLDPLQRPSARELEKHAWLATAFSC